MSDQNQNEEIVNDVVETVEAPEAPEEATEKVAETETEDGAETDAEETPETDHAVGAPESKPIVVRRRRPKVAEDKAEAPKRRARKVVADKVDKPVKAPKEPKTDGPPEGTADIPDPLDGEDVVRSGQEPADLNRSHGKFRTYQAETTRVQNAIKDLRNYPIPAGSLVNPQLVYGERWGEVSEKVLKNTDGKVRQDGSFIFLGTNPAGDLFWLVSTKGSKIVRMREDKNGKITKQLVDPARIETEHYIGLRFNMDEFEYWQADRPKGYQEYRLNARADEVAEARRQAAAAKKAQEQKKAPVAVKKPVIRRKTSAKKDSVGASK